MKRCLLMVLTIIPVLAHAGKLGPDCTLNGKKLYGKVRVVDSFPTFKVRVTNAFPDLKVEKVTAFPDRCGRWEFVTAFEDFSVQFVDAFEDFSIDYVTSFPRVP